MNESIKVPKSRFVNQNIFDAGEQFISLTDSENRNYLIRVDKQFTFGQVSTYMSNKFDIQWDDSKVSDPSVINGFIRDNVDSFKPSFMELRDVKSILPYTIVSDGNSSTVRTIPSENDNIVVPSGPNVICR